MELEQLYIMVCDENEVLKSRVQELELQVSKINCLIADARASFAPRAELEEALRLAGEELLQKDDGISDLNASLDDAIAELEQERAKSSRLEITLHDATLKNENINSTILALELKIDALIERITLGK